MCWAPGVLKTVLRIHSFHPPVGGGGRVWPYLPLSVGQLGIRVTLEPLETEDENCLGASQKSTRETKERGISSCHVATVRGNSKGLEMGPLGQGHKGAEHQCVSY